jgi:hypothetical protein
MASTPALRLYRELLRVASRLPRDARDGAVDTIRSEFRKHATASGDEAAALLKVRVPHTQCMRRLPLKCARRVQVGQSKLDYLLMVAPQRATAASRAPQQRTGKRRFVVGRDGQLEEVSIAAEATTTTAGPVSNWGAGNPGSRITRFWDHC